MTTASTDAPSTLSSAPLPPAAACLRAPPRWAPQAAGLLAAATRPGRRARRQRRPGARLHGAQCQVNGTTIHYRVGGKGPAVVLLHGYAETSHMWNPLMPLLAKTHTVIVPDLRGAGGSAKPEGGYDKKNMAVDIHELVKSLGINSVAIVGHDIGLMVAYAYAAQFPTETSRVVLMDAFLPGIGNWTNVWLLRDLWHFHFHGKTPLALVKGRERTYFEHFWNDFAADPKHSLPEADRRIYAAAYAQEGGMRAGFEYFKNFEKDAADFRRAGQHQAAHAHAGAVGRKSRRHVPDRAGQAGGD
jgi:pimeloyl-ACP methyl ester carboxylesterase